MVSPAASSRVSREAVDRAVEALLKWMRARAKQRKAQLLEHDDLLYLVVTVKRIPPTSRTNSYHISLPHPLHPFDGSTSICLLVDDRPSSPLPPSAARARVQSDSVPVDDVIGLSDLRSDYRPFEARRRLCGSHDLFFADRRILPLLPRLLGKHFFKKKRIPLPVDLSRKGWPEQIRQCCASTLLFLRTGTCSGLKVGRVSQSRDDIADNVMAAIEGAVEYIPRKWVNVRSLHIKSVESLALPIYQTMPELGLKIEVGAQKKVEEAKEAEKDTKKKSSRGSTEKVSKKKKGRIHEVQYLDMDLEYGGSEDDDGSIQEEDGGEGNEIDELVVEKNNKGKAKNVKDKKSIRDVPPLSGEQTVVADEVMNEDDGQMHLDVGKDEKDSDKVGVEKRMKKAKKGRDKKGKRYDNKKSKDDGEGDKKGSDEPGEEKGKKKKKTRNDVTLKKEKKDKTSNSDGSLLSDEAGTIVDRMKKNSKTKKLDGKDAKKIKRSKVRHEID